VSILNICCSIHLLFINKNLLTRVYNGHIGADYLELVTVFFSGFFFEVTYEVYMFLYRHLDINKIQVYRYNCPLSHNDLFKFNISLISQFIGKASYRVLQLFSCKFC